MLLKLNNSFVLKKNNLFKQHKKVVKGQTQDLKEVKPFSQYLKVGESISQDLKVGAVKSETSR